MTSKRVEWKWADDGSHVHVDGRMFTVAEIRPEQLAVYAERWGAAAWVHDHLVQASQSIKAGIGDYLDACDRLHHLRAELGKARAAVRSIASDVGGFFTTDGLATGFGNDVERLAGFVQEAVMMLGARAAAPAAQDATRTPGPKVENGKIVPMPPSAAAGMPEAPAGSRSSQG